MNARLVTRNLRHQRQWHAYRRSLAPVRDYRWGVRLLKRLHASLVVSGVLFHPSPGPQARAYRVEGV